MGQTLILLTATWLAGQDMRLQPIAHDEMSGGCSSCQGNAGPAAGCRIRGCRLFNRDSDRPGFFQRCRGALSGLFPGYSDYANQGYTGSTPPPALNVQPGDAYPKLSNVKVTEPPLNELARKPATTKPAVAPINFQAAAPASKSAISQRLVDKVGHENDYSWVTGQIFKENGQWVVRYATPEMVDRYGGSFILAPGVDTSKIRQGDLVSVHGQPDGTGANGTLYRATSVDFIEHEN